VIRISEHAVRKYKTIMSKKNRRSLDPENELLDLLNESTKEDMHAGLVKRTITNDSLATYYRNGEWRFVIIDNTMVTAELNTFDYSGLGITKNDNRKRSKKAWKWKKKKSVL